MAGKAPEAGDLTVRDPDYDSDEDYTRSKDDWEKYSKQITESEVDGFPGTPTWKEIVPCSLKKLPQELIENVEVAVMLYNIKEKTSLKFLDITNMTCRISCVTCYITFRAKDMVTGQVGIYQTVIHTLCQDDADQLVGMTRLKPGTKPEPEGQGAVTDHSTAVGPSGVKVVRERDAEEEKEEKKLKV